MADSALIIGQPDDPHVQKVGEHLRGMGIRPVLFDLSTDVVDMSVHRGIASGYVVGGQADERVDFEDIRSVWNRLKQRCDDSDPDPAVRAERRFAWSEWIECLDSMTHYVAPGRWVNSPVQDQLMCRKAIQHTLASQLGFRVPETAITNDADSVLQLFSRHERVIYKPNRSSHLTDGRFIFTTEIDPERVRGSAAEIAAAPGIYQELIEKAYELRVMIVGEAVFPVRIDSQECESTAIDWRRTLLGPEYHHAVEIDADLSRRLLQFHARAKLVYGAYDLIVTKEGEPVFLEVNPAGQWMWMEDALDLPISRAVAVELAEC
jgi:hypothetical protein